jgi:hypothetical protein
MQGNGAFKQADFFENIGGLNLSDSPFKVKENQAVGGQNYTYTQTGAIRKRRGHSKLNSSADAQLQSLGLLLRNTTSGTKSVIRAAGTKLQLVDTSVATFTNLTDDTAAASSAFLTSGSTQTVVGSQFNNASADILWCAGGGMSSLYGVYSTSKVTANGSATPTGSISPAAAGTGGTFASTGYYRYAVALRKLGTQALSNCDLDKEVNVTATTQTVTVTLTLTSVDVTKYDAVYLYRSAVSATTLGNVAFTTGDLVSITSITSGVPASIADTGTYTTTAGNVPRASSVTLDNSVLPSGTYKTLTTFKRRLVTATGTTLYLSDLNKSESWPATNTIVIPSGGPITALGVISFTTVGSNTIDEVLVIFKEREVWVLTGTSYSDWVLKFIDNTGCPTQSLLVTANGFMTWLDYRGFYIWDGTGKPVYASRLIEALFAADGDLDKGKLTYGTGQFYMKQNSVIWALPHKTYGTQKFYVKMDLRLTLPSVEASLAGRMLEAVFLEDSTSWGSYAMLSYLPSTSEEVLLLGDDAGYLYTGFAAESDASAAFSMAYATPFLAMGNPNIIKRFNTVIVWVEELGTYNLTMDFWTDFKGASNNRSTRALPISSVGNSTVALWDVAYWDTAYWDTYTPKIKPLYFQLNSDSINNSEGTALKLQFRQEGANQPVTVVGYSVLYNETGLKRA